MAYLADKIKNNFSQKSYSGCLGLEGHQGVPKILLTLENQIRAFDKYKLELKYDFYISQNP